MSKQPDFTKGLVPAIIQDASTRTVLMLGYMNEEAYAKTVSEQRVTFFSRSKNRLWTKGEESGNFLDVISLSIDCDADTILIQAKPAGPTCHTGADTCFNESNADNAAWLDQLKHVIRSRKTAPASSSYTASLFQLGTHKVAQKVGEEAVELVIEAKDNNKDLFLGEAADLLFHYLILLEEKEIDFDEVIDVLIHRHK